MKIDTKQQASDGLQSPIRRSPRKVSGSRVPLLEQHQQRSQSFDFGFEKEKEEKQKVHKPPTLFRLIHSGLSLISLCLVFYANYAPTKHQSHDLLTDASRPSCVGPICSVLFYTNLLTLIFSLISFAIEFLAYENQIVYVKIEKVLTFVMYLLWFAVHIGEFLMPGPDGYFYLNNKTWVLITLLGWVTFVAGYWHMHSSLITKYHSYLNQHTKSPVKGSERIGFRLGFLVLCFLGNRTTEKVFMMRLLDQTMRVLSAYLLKWFQPYRDYIELVLDTWIFAIQTLLLTMTQIYVYKTEETIECWINVFAFLLSLMSFLGTLGLFEENSRTGSIKLLRQVEQV